MASTVACLCPPHLEPGHPWEKIVGFVTLHKSVPDTRLVDSQSDVCFIRELIKQGFLSPGSINDSANYFDSQGILPPAPPTSLPQKKAFSKTLCLTSASPFTGKPKILEEIPTSPSQRKMVTSSSNHVQFSDPCPEAREKLQEMCRHM